jgi:hypothetical protein
VLHAAASVIPRTTRQFFAICHPTPLRCQLKTKLMATQPNARSKAKPRLNGAEALRYHNGKHRIAFRHGAIWTELQPGSDRVTLQ